MTATGVVHLVGAGPGNPDLLTLKAARLRGEARVVVYDRLVGDGIRDLIPVGASRIGAGKARGSITPVRGRSGGDQCPVGCQFPNRRPKMSLSMRAIVDWTAGVGVALAILSGISLSALGALPPAVDPASASVSAERAGALRYLLTQDCGSCHGLSLAGGLGPPLRRESVADKPVEFLAYTILNGRPGTAMPPWSVFLTDAEGLWLARELKGLNP